MLELEDMLFMNALALLDLVQCASVGAWWGLAWLCWDLLACFPCPNNCSLVAHQGAISRNLATSLKTAFGPSSGHELLLFV